MSESAAASRVTLVMVGLLIEVIGVVKLFFSIGGGLLIIAMGIAPIWVGYYGYTKKAGKER